MLTIIARALYRVLGHRICCGRIPGWTAHVGQTWDTYDVAQANLYNALWRLQQLIRRRVG